MICPRCQRQVDDTEEFLNHMCFDHLFSEKKVLAFLLRYVRDLEERITRLEKASNKCKCIHAIY